MSSFAKRELMKYGWTEGQGVGKDAQGIATSINPKRRSSKNGDAPGLGYGTASADAIQNEYEVALQQAANRKRKRGEEGKGERSPATAPASHGVLKDSELFELCNGVRLGRSGRHRVFGGKLSRIEQAEGGSTTTTTVKQQQPTPKQ